MEQLRESFIEACSGLGRPLFSKSDYDEIIEVLTGRRIDDKPSTRRRRNAGSRYIVKENNGVVELIRKNKAMPDDSRRIVHSMELFDIILNAQRDNQISSATRLHECVLQKYSNISLPICQAYMRCLKDQNLAPIAREGYFSLVDMRQIMGTDAREQWALLYQDFPSQRIYARELRYGSVKATTVELLKIFIIDGPPQHIYAGSDRRFVKGVLSGISSIDPEIKIELKRTRFLKHQIQNEVDFKARLLVWINQNLTVRWTLGLYYCAAYLNRNPMDLERKACRLRSSPSEAQHVIEEAAVERSLGNSQSTSRSVADAEDASQISSPAEDASQIASPLAVNSLLTLAASTVDSGGEQLASDALLGSLGVLDAATVDSGGDQVASDALLGSLGVPDASTVNSSGDQLASNVVVISDDGTVNIAICYISYLYS